MSDTAEPSVFPTSQAELLKMARGQMTQAEFAKQLGVERSCLSRYESEKLGAPASVISYCLRALAKVENTRPESTLEKALWSARQTLTTLEELASGGSPNHRQRGNRRR